MISKITFNKYAQKVRLKQIRVSKNKEFFIWDFETPHNKKFVGFSAITVYFGNKTHLWYSLLVGYFLPHSYNMNFDNIIGKECYAIPDGKGVIRSIVPIDYDSKKTQPPQDRVGQEPIQSQAEIQSPDTEEKETPSNEQDENLFT